METELPGERLTGRGSGPEWAGAPEGNRPRRGSPALLGPGSDISGFPGPGTLWPPASQRPGGGPWDGGGLSPPSLTPLTSRTSAGSKRASLEHDPPKPALGTEFVLRPQVICRVSSFIFPRNARGQDCPCPRVGLAESSAGRMVSGWKAFPFNRVRVAGAPAPRGGLFFRDGTCQSHVRVTYPLFLS